MKRQTLKELKEKVAVEYLHLQLTKIPRCLTCKLNYEPLDQYTWKPACKCIKKPLILNIG